MQTQWGETDLQQEVGALKRKLNLEATTLANEKGLVLRLNEQLTELRETHKEDVFKLGAERERATKAEEALRRKSNDCKTLEIQRANACDEISRLQVKLKEETAATKRLEYELEVNSSRSAGAAQSQSKQLEEKEKRVQQLLGDLKKSNAALEQAQAASSSKMTSSVKVVELESRIAVLTADNARLSSTKSTTSRPSLSNTTNTASSANSDAAAQRSRFGYSTAPKPRLSESQSSASQPGRPSSALGHRPASSMGMHSQLPVLSSNKRRSSSISILPDSTKINGLERDLADSRVKTEGLEKELTGVRAKLGVKERELLKIENQLLALQKESKDSLAAAEDRLDDLRDELALEKEDGKSAVEAVKEELSAATRSLRTEKEALLQKVERLREEVLKREEAVERAEMEREEVELQLENLAGELESSRRKARSADGIEEELNQLRSEQEASHAEFASIIGQRDDLSNELSSANAALAEKTAFIATLTAQLSNVPTADLVANLEESNAALTAQVDQLHTERESLAASISLLEAELEIVEGELTLATEEEIPRLEEDLDDALEQIVELKDVLEEAEGALDDARNDLAEEREESEGQLEEMTRAIETAEDISTAYKAQVERLETEIGHHRSVAADLRQELVDAQDKDDGEDELMESIRAQLTDALEQKSILGEEVRRLAVAKEEQSLLVTELEFAVEDLKRDLAKSSDTISDFESRIVQEGSLRSAAESYSEDLRSQVVDLSAGINKAERALAESTREVTELRAAFEETSSSALDTEATLRDQISRLEGDLYDQQERASLLGSQVEQAERDASRLSAELVSFQRRQDDLSAHLQSSRTPSPPSSPSLASDGGSHPFDVSQQIVLVSRLREERDNLRDMLEFTKNEARFRYRELQDRVAEHASATQVAQLDREELEASLIASKTERGSLTAKVDEMGRELARLEASLKVATTSLDEAHSANDRTIQDLADVESKLDSTARDVRTHQQRADEATTALRLAEQRVSQVSAELDVIRSGRHELSSDAVEQLEAQVAALEDRITRRTRQIESHELTISALTAKLATAIPDTVDADDTVDLSGTPADTSALESALQRNEAALQFERNRRSSLEGQLESVQAQLRSIEEGDVAARAELQTALSDLEVSRIEHAQAHTQLAAVQSELTLSRESAATLEAALKQTGDLLADERTQLVDIQSRLTEAESALQAAVEARDSRDQQLADLVFRVEDEEHQRSELEDLLAAAESRLETANNDLSTALEHTLSLEDDLASAIEARDALSTDLTTSRAAFEDLTKRHMELEAEYSNLSDSVEEATRSHAAQTEAHQKIVDSLNQEVELVSTELETAVAEKVRLDQEVQHLSEERESNEAALQEQKKLLERTQEAKELLAAAQTKLEQSEFAVSSIQHQLDETESAVVERNAALEREVASLRTDAERVTTDQINSEAEREQAAARVKQLTDEKAQLASALDEARAEQETTVAQLQGEVAKATLARTTIEASSTREIRALRGLTATAQSQVKELERECMALEELVKDADGLRDENSRLQQQIVGVMADREQNITEVIVQLERVEGEKLAADQRIAVLEEQTLQLDSALAVARTSSSTVNDELLTQVQTLQRQLEQQSADCDEAETKYNEVLHTQKRYINLIDRLKIRVEQLNKERTLSRQALAATTVPTLPPPSSTTPSASEAPEPVSAQKKRGRPAEFDSAPLPPRAVIAAVAPPSSGPARTVPSALRERPIVVPVAIGDQENVAPRSAFKPKAVADGFVPLKPAAESPVVKRQVLGGVVLNGGAVGGLSSFAAPGPEAKRDMMKARLAGMSTVKKV